MNNNKKLAIIGASNFQNPLILKAKDMGIETHVFAWEVGDIGEYTADFFYPISIAEKEAILDKCREVGIDGIASIGSDFANITVAYVADALGLTANSVECVADSTDKSAMRYVFEKNGDPSPRSFAVSSLDELSEIDLMFPIIVKPADRSGSRGIARLDALDGIQDAVLSALEESFSDTAVLEEFVSGREFSIEGLSWRGTHEILSITEKFTTGAPHFIETGHLEPAQLDSLLRDRICEVVERALGHLGVTYGASHAEVKVDGDGNVWIIEIGSRMGGDCIGSDLVELSTGYDYVRAVVDIALGRKPKAPQELKNQTAAIRFILSEEDRTVLSNLESQHPDWLRRISLADDLNRKVTDSSTRLGFFIFSGGPLDEMIRYLPVYREDY